MSWSPVLSSAHGRPLLRRNARQVWGSLRQAESQHSGSRDLPGLGVRVPESQDNRDGWQVKNHHLADPGNGVSTLSSDAAVQCFCAPQSGLGGGRCIQDFHDFFHGRLYRTLRVWHPGFETCQFFEGLSINIKKFGSKLIPKIGHNCQSKVLLTHCANDLFCVCVCVCGGWGARRVLVSRPPKLVFYITLGHSKFVFPPLDSWLCVVIWRKKEESMSWLYLQLKRIICDPPWPEWSPWTGEPGHQLLGELPLVHRQLVHRQRGGQGGVGARGRGISGERARDEGGGSTRSRWRGLSRSSPIRSMRRWLVGSTKPRWQRPPTSPPGACRALTFRALTFRALTLLLAQTLSQVPITLVKLTHIRPRDGSSLYPPMSFLQIIGRSRTSKNRETEARRKRVREPDYWNSSEEQLLCKKKLLLWGTTASPKKNYFSEE